MGYFVDDSFKISLKIAGKTLNLGMKDMSLTISDSIYNLIPSASLEVDDIYGIWIESRYASLNENLTICIGTKEKEVELPCVFSSFETPSISGGNALNGTFRANLLHKAVVSPRENKVYKNQSPSEIFEAIIKDKTAGLKTSSSSISYETIYNPYYDIKTFTERILLHLALSEPQSVLPYYAFIDTQNFAHFQSIKDLISSKECIKCHYGIGTGAEDGSNSNTYLTSAYPFSNSLESIDNHLDEKFSYWDEEKESYEYQERKLTSIASPIPLVRDKASFVQNPCTDFDCKPNLNEIYGCMNYNIRRNLLIDRLIVSMPLNMKITSGCILDLNSYLNTNEPVKANSYTGKFLVESSQHTWDRKSGTGFTSCIIGRMSIPTSAKNTYYKG